MKHCIHVPTNDARSFTVGKYHHSQMQTDRKEVIAHLLRNISTHLRIFDISWKIYKYTDSLQLPSMQYHRNEM